MTYGTQLAERVGWVQRRCNDLVRNVEHFIHGKTNVIWNAIVGLLAEGHLLIEDVPGVAKTSLAKAIAHSIGGSMRRIQFTPDLLPSDVVGVQIYDTHKGQFQFKEGPVFGNILLADEINRASPKTQSALLEAMAERQVTVDGVTYPLPRPNFVIATQNPVDQQGTYSLPEAQLDRFMMLLRIGYPTPEHEVRIVGDAIARRLPEQLQPVCTIEDMQQMIEVVRGIYVAPALQAFIVTITNATRTIPQLKLGASPRASNALATASQARAAVDGRAFVTADDVKQMAKPVLAHRLVLTPEAAVQEFKPEGIVDRILAAVPVPQAPVGA
ncbi:MoxR family ATPase [Kibdelosporangium aridum]|uniref:MoxR family ATPase n=1 Tax=Kibdelosporangium aridum TaxID=2030 RepID=A0A428XTF1_KIBAR|nr:MoxR family ATPase [Kibdelosporangium aridum]RSM58621.1 MoxR family ATPase [Kibdelosporangium aridum]